MIRETVALDVELTLATALMGFVIGLVYFAALHKSVVLFATESTRLGASALTIGRIVALAVILSFTARLGATPLLAAFLGFLLARAIALRVARVDK